MSEWISVKDVNGCHIPDKYKIQPTGYISCKKDGFCKDLFKFCFVGINCNNTCEKDKCLL